MSNKNEFLLRTLKKVFDDDGKKYWFDVLEYIKLSERFDNSRLHAKVESNPNCELTCNPDSLKHKITRFNNYAFGMGNGRISLEMIKQMGFALKNDEYAFLLPINSKSFENLISSYEVDNVFEGVNKVYSRLNNLLYQLESSCFYNFAPNPEKDAQIYYNNELQKIRQTADNECFGNTEIREKLHEIINEVEHIIFSYSMPGVPNSWLEINPNIKYFDCVYDFMRAKPRWRIRKHRCKNRCLYK